MPIACIALDSRNAQQHRTEYTYKGAECISSELQRKRSANFSAPRQRVRARAAAGAAAAGEAGHGVRVIASGSGSGEQNQMKTRRINLQRSRLRATSYELRIQKSTVVYVLVFDADGAANSLTQLVEY